MDVDGWNDPEMDFANSVATLGDGNVKSSSNAATMENPGTSQWDQLPGFGLNPNSSGGSAGTMDNALTQKTLSISLFSNGSTGGMASKRNFNQMMEAVTCGGGGGGSRESCNPVDTSFNWPKPASSLGNSGLLPDFYAFNGAKRSKPPSTGDALKIGCSCKKTACLKLYCECFKSDMYCSKETCSCNGCYNTEDYEDTVEIAREQKLSHKSNAKAKSDDFQDLNNKTDKPPPVRPEKGCKCLKSKCVNKYCECYKADKGCCNECRCENCKNYYGVKSAPLNASPLGHSGDVVQSLC